MHFLTVVTSALICGVSFAVPAPHYGNVLHGKRSHNLQLVRRHRAPPATTLPVRIAVTQNNLDIGHQRLMEISDPTSSKYGQHMSAIDVGDLFRPSNQSIESVREWLHSAGIDTARHRVSLGRGWLKFEASVKELESLLSTKYHVYKHSDTKEEHIGCEDYHVPHSVHPHIEFIHPTVSTIKVKRRAAKNAEMIKSFSPASFTPHIKPADFSPAADTSPGSEIPCFLAVTPACIRDTYGVPMGNSSHAGNEIGIFEDGDFYSQSDLDLTFEALAPYVPKGTHPTLNGIDGGIAPLVIDGQPVVGLESLLDMSLILPLVHPQEAILFQVDDLKEVEDSLGFGDTFLDALDASYCKFEGGDDPALDPKYPDTAPNPPGSFIPNGTWDKPEMCGAYKPTNVISVSYGLGENLFDYFYWNRQCTEYMKLSLQGVTVVYSSGDAGVSNRGSCILPDIVPNGTDTGANPGAFSPSFPASCPYVTTVGATQFNSDGKETAVSVPEEGYYSGGGFSNYWPIPSYQETTVAKYLTTSDPFSNKTIYGTPYFNHSGRAYPDVAAVGLDILLYAEGQPNFLGGTSASAPIFASMITLINERRLDAGKKRVGFLNPTLYKNPDAFTDITIGNNPGCNTQGFSCVKGWDPVTGLGTPIFDKLLEVFMALP